MAASLISVGLAICCYVIILQLHRWNILRLPSLLFNRLHRINSLIIHEGLLECLALCNLLSSFAVLYLNIKALQLNSSLRIAYLALVNTLAKHLGSQCI